MARYLVEHLGFRTIAWEEGWGSGVAIDRYVTSGHGDPTAVVGDALFMLQTEAMLELVGWMREFNRGRPDHDKVRFLGADVLELRPIQFDEIRRHVADVAPGQREDLEAHLAPIDWRGDPFTQLGWYTQLTAAAQRMVIAHAHEVDDLVRALPAGSSAVSRADAVQHAHALLGFTRRTAPTGTPTTSATGTSPRSSTAGGTAPATDMSPSASPSTTVRSSPAGRSSPAAPRSTTSRHQTSPLSTMSWVRRGSPTT
ncbi:MAG TPA: erythromycin esterase family protein [Actinomycetota bacterium]|nr:erythromycin esterase family protein [Actinomycetota bacterium]